MLVKHKHICNSDKPTTTKVVPVDAGMSPSNMMQQIVELRAEVRELKDIITQLIRVQSQNQTPIMHTVVEAPNTKEAKPKKSKPKTSTKKNHTPIDPTNIKIKPLYSPDTSLENVDDLINRMKAVRSVEDITELVVSRCEDIYFRNPVNRSFQVSSEGQASFFDTIDNQWKDTTLTRISKDMFNFATEDVLDKIESFEITLSSESQAAWDRVGEMYDMKIPTHFSRTTTEKIVSTLLYPEMERVKPI